MDYILGKHIGIENHKVYLQDIIYVKSNGDYCLLVTKSKTYSYHSTMNKTEDILGDKFSRVSRTHIVNVSCIDEIADHIVYIHGIEIPLSEFSKRSQIDYKGNLYKKLGLGNRKPIYIKAK